MPKSAVWFYIFSSLDKVPYFVGLNMNVSISLFWKSRLKLHSDIKDIVEGKAIGNHEKWWNKALQ